MITTEFDRAGLPARLRHWWQGTLLIARRGLLETVRAKSFRIITAVMLIASVASVAVPVMLSGRTTTYTLATVGRPAPELAAILATAARDGDFAVEYRALADLAAVRDAVERRDATVGLVEGTLFVSTRQPGPFGAIVSQAVVSAESTRVLQAARLTPSQVAAVTSVRPPAQVDVGGGMDGGRLAVGFAVGIVIYLAISLAGAAIATMVAIEKSTRISEVLLAVLRPSQVLVGTVLAVGAVTLAQLVLLAAPLAVTSAVSDVLALPTATGADLALAILWFVLGFGLYAFAFAAAAALVEKVTEVSGVTGVVTMVLMLGYFGAIFVSTQGADSGLGTVLSMFPLSAPLVMPVRWASGDVPVVQLLLAVGLTAAAVALVIALASRFYARALVITGHRVRLRELRH